MIVFVILLAMIIVSGSKCAVAGQFNQDYISRDNTTVIKGIFVALILLSHGKAYINLSGAADNLYVQFQDHLNQMVVSMFLFYSGYGIMESIKKKRFNYVKSIATKRFPSVYLNFIIAVCCFIVMNAILRMSYPIKDILLAFTGWTSIGNSNWYMFAIFGLYILTFISFLPMKLYKNEKADLLCIILLTLLSCGFVFFQIYLKRPMYCYNTIILFPLGLWYSYFKNTIEKLLMKNDGLYFAFAALLFAVYLISFKHRWHYGIEGYTVWAVCFTLLTVMLTMKISIKSSFLEFLGNHVFSIYMLQRIPFTVFQRLGLNATFKYGYLILSYITTFCLILVFDYLTQKLQNKIWSKKA